MTVEFHVVTVESRHRILVEFRIALADLVSANSRPNHDPSYRTSDFLGATPL